MHKRGCRGAMAFHNFRAIFYLFIVLHLGIIVDRVNSVNIDLVGSGETSIAAVGQTVRFKCTLSGWNESGENDEVYWIRHLTTLEFGQVLYKITEEGHQSESQFNHISLNVSSSVYTLVLEDVEVLDSGTYACVSNKNLVLTDINSITLVVTNTAEPTKTTDGSTINTTSITKTLSTLPQTSLPPSAINTATMTSSTSHPSTETVALTPTITETSALPQNVSKSTLLITTNTSASNTLPHSSTLPQTTHPPATLPQTNLSFTTSLTTLQTTPIKCSKSCLNGICGWDSTGDTETCLCNKGFQYLDQDTCQDIDECLDASHMCSGPNVRCVNHVGSYSCQCIPGYSYKQDGTCIASLTYLGKFTLESIENQNVYWNDSLENDSSKYFIWLSLTIELLMDEILRSDDRTHSNYLGTQMESFHQGSIIAEFTTRFENNQEEVYSSSSDMEMDSDSFSVILHDYINGSSMSFGNFSIGIDPTSVVITDFNECSDPLTNDCSSHAECINTEGSFLCQCEDSYLDVSDEELKDPGRVCTMQYDYKIMFIILGVVGSLLFLSVCTILACYCYFKGRSSRDVDSKPSSRASERPGLDTRSSLMRMEMMTDNENAITPDYDEGPSKNMTEFYLQPDVILPATYPLSLQKYAPLSSNGTVPGYDYPQYPSAVGDVITTISLSVDQDQGIRSASYWSHPEVEGATASEDRVPVSRFGDPRVIPRARPAYFSNTGWSTRQGAMPQISVMDYF